MKVPFLEDIEVGYEIPSLTKSPSNIQLFMFSAITWNRHRIHYDADFARNHDKLPNVVTHRALLGNFLAQMLSDWLQENGKLKRLEWSVRGSALPGNQLTCRGKVATIRREEDEGTVECEVWIENQRGESIVPGKAEVIVTSRESAQTIT